MSGRWTFAGVVDLPASTIDEAALKPGALIPAAKVVARFAKDHRQAAGADVAAKTELIHIAKYAGIVASIEAAIDSAITGDNTVTVDLKKSSGGGAFASLPARGAWIETNQTRSFCFNGAVAPRAGSVD